MTASALSAASMKGSPARLDRRRPLLLRGCPVNGKAPFLAHLDHRPGVVRANVLTVSQSEALATPPAGGGAAVLLDSFGAVPANRRMGPGTGMRRKSCAAWSSPDPELGAAAHGDRSLVSVGLTVTKGDRPRVVYPPLRLIDRTGWYIGEDRAALIKRLRRGDLAYRARRACS